MIRFFAEGLRFIGALFYWNARKTSYVLRRRRDRCPCQHPSDSGRGGETACEAVQGWRTPARFKWVCPLLEQDATGRWVCSVDAAQVRPFWGRVVAVGAATGVLAIALVGLGVFGVLRGLDYPVELRHVFWPPAWKELPAVQARMFVVRGEEDFRAGRTREGVASLVQAQRLDPSNYEASLLLARLSQSSDPQRAWDLLRNLARAHPERRTEVSQVAVSLLLTHGRWEDLAKLAADELARDAPGEGAWLHALATASRRSGQPAWLREAARSAARPAVRRTLELMAAVGEAGDATARHLLLGSSPPDPECVYDRLFRIEELIRLGATDEARTLLAARGAGLTGRDIARFSLAARVRQGDRAWVRQQFSAMLRPERPLRAPEVELLALHLIEWPDPALVRPLAEALPRIQADGGWEQFRAVLALWWAVGLSGGERDLSLVCQGRLTALSGGTGTFVEKMTLAVNAASEGKPYSISILSDLPTVPLELAYALWRYDELKRLPGAPSGRP